MELLDSSGEFRFIPRSLFFIRFLLLLLPLEPSTVLLYLHHCWRQSDQVNYLLKNASRFSSTYVNRHPSIIISLSHPSSQTEAFFNNNWANVTMLDLLTVLAAFDTQTDIFVADALAAAFLKLLKFCRACSLYAPLSYDNKPLFMSPSLKLSSLVLLFVTCLLLRLPSMDSVSQVHRILSTLFLFHTTRISSRASASRNIHSSFRK